MDTGSGFCMCITLKKYINYLNHFVKIDNSVIEWVNLHKYLGIQIDNKLSLKENIDYICKKVGKKIWTDVSAWKVLNSLEQNYNIQINGFYSFRLLCLVVVLGK